jgi:hypothetical protein
MRQASFKLLTEVVVFLVVTPLAWFVYSRFSALWQLAFAAVALAVAFVVKRFVYEPIHRRLPE